MAQVHPPVVVRRERCDDALPHFAPLVEATVMGAAEGDYLKQAPARPM